MAIRGTAVRPTPSARLLKTAADHSVRKPRPGGARWTGGSGEDAGAPASSCVAGVVMS